MIHNKNDDKNDICINTNLNCYVYSTGNNFEYGSRGSIIIAILSRKHSLHKIIRHYFYIKCLNA